MTIPRSRKLLEVNEKYQTKDLLCYIVYDTINTTVADHVKTV